VREKGSMPERVSWVQSSGNRHCKFYGRVVYCLYVNQKDVAVVRHCSRDIWAVVWVIPLAI